MEITDDEIKRMKDDRTATMRKLRAPTLKAYKGAVTTKLTVEKLEEA